MILSQEGKAKGDNSNMYLPNYKLGFWILGGIFWFFGLFWSVGFGGFGLGIFFLCLDLFFFFSVRTFDVGWIQVSFSSCCFDCIRNEAESFFLNLCSIFFQKSVLHSCAFHVFGLVPGYLCGDCT